VILVTKSPTNCSQFVEGAHWPLLTYFNSKSRRSEDRMQARATHRWERYVKAKTRAKAAAVSRDDAADVSETAAASSSSAAQLPPPPLPQTTPHIITTVIYQEPAGLEPGYQPGRPSQSGDAAVVDDDCDTWGSWAPSQSGDAAVVDDDYDTWGSWATSQDAAVVDADAGNTSDGLSTWGETVWQSWWSSAFWGDDDESAPH
jgi:hypothetical protein